MVRYNNAGTVEIERITVPLAYASKEKFYKRITQDTELTREQQITLPRMAFSMDGMTYDPLRKISSHIDSFAEGTAANKIKRVKMTPYNFDFNLHIFVRNTEDGMQIVEQILPFFNPDYTLTVDFLSLDNLKLDVPIILNAVNYDDSYEGDMESTRTLIWTLNFTVKGYLFGPISSSNLITKANSSIYNNTFANNPLQKFVLWNTGTLDFKVDELVYQGNNLETATASGYVKQYIPTTNTVVLYDTTGVFKTNNYINGVVSNASYNIKSLDIVDPKLVLYTVEPSPNTANSTDDYGFTETIVEYYV